MASTVRGPWAAPLLGVNQSEPIPPIYLGVNGSLSHLGEVLAEFGDGWLILDDQDVHHGRVAQQFAIYAALVTG